MKVYRGDSTSDFKIENFKLSRYGFKALFFSTSLEIAKLYAVSRANEERNWNGGSVYEFNILEPYWATDFNFEVTHSAKFRNLIHNIHKQRVPSALIINCFDFPTDELQCFTESDLVVVFDFSQIQDYKLIESRIK